ncbi:hypothetical protein B4135_2540 [Caldibacillus debilis]|uniref:Uncharacterized protein n=1 Tax=Caldibacillus debilis TaxID=301148 RepID=A0A150LYL0_9BACI|nr:hypothetical protein B4135_2540 [Caldibacillus debilis]
MGFRHSSGTHFLYIPKIVRRVKVTRLNEQAFPGMSEGSG